MRHRGWLRRLEARTEGGVVRVTQRDGTTRVFGANEFWRQLYLSEVAAAVGKRRPTPVSRAVETATEEAQAKIRALIVSEGGEFLQAATADGFGNIAAEAEDLSEPGPRATNDQEGG